MKVITWNCNMAFRKKAALVVSMQPDILVVPECECPDKLQFNTSIPAPTDTLWFGENKNKGLGIFSYGSYRLKLRRNHNSNLKMIVPVAVNNGTLAFTLYAIWANNPQDPDGQYVEQVWKAVNHYKKHLGRSSMLIGDFNSNTIWDRKYRTGNHSHVVQLLEKKGIKSCYHLHHVQEQGKEMHPTFYLYKHIDKPYHLDYCFVSRDMAEKISAVEIGDHAYWSRYSDHVPVIVTLDV